MATRRQEHSSPLLVLDFHFELRTLMVNVQQKVVNLHLFGEHSLRLDLFLLQATICFRHNLHLQNNRNDHVCQEIFYPNRQARACYGHSS